MKQSQRYIQRIIDDFIAISDLKSGNKFYIVPVDGKDNVFAVTGTDGVDTANNGLVFDSIEASIRYVKNHCKNQY